MLTFPPHTPHPIITSLMALVSVLLSQQDTVFMCAKMLFFGLWTTNTSTLNRLHKFHLIFFLSAEKAISHLKHATIRPISNSFQLHLLLLSIDSEINFSSSRSVSVIIKKTPFNVKSSTAERMSTLGAKQCSE